MDLTQTLYDIENGIATVTLNRPDKMNAFTSTMRKELIGIFAEADCDDAVRVIVVTGAGKAFCAGADLSAGGSSFDRAMNEGRKVSMSEHRDGGGQTSLAIFKCRKPVIAAINGHAVGIGITMTLAMDIRVVAGDAKIGFVFARRGVVPEACSSWFLPRIVGISKATELVYTGRLFLAEEEATSGLFNYVVPSKQVLPKAMAIAREIAENTSAVSVALSKGLLWHGLSEDDPQSVHLIDSRCFFWAGRQKDAYEGVQSFLEKRAPRFTMSASTDMPDFYPWWKEPKV
ncbi:MAG: crotonase/enoyl-CoA hydratase family protein [Deltaproteobacteria bacterium]|nr:crotonase/enoyl-CoA hydratase family protein [Deltaproteobacteria bacterium]